MQKIHEKITALEKQLSPECRDLIDNWQAKEKLYKDGEYNFTVRNKTIKIQTHTESLSHSQIPKISTPRYQAWGDLLHWQLQENVPVCLLEKVDPNVPINVFTM